MKIITLSSVKEFALAVRKLLQELLAHHKTVLARKDKKELTEWQEFLHKAHVEIRNSAGRFPSNLRLDDPDVVEVLTATKTIANLVNECKQAYAKLH